MKKLLVIFFIFTISRSFAGYIDDIPNGCGTFRNINAIFIEASQNDYVTCTQGYFLPANSRNCAECPNGYTCIGGVYLPNTEQSQGLTHTANYYTANESKACASNFPRNLNAVFVEGRTCTSGQYLPKNTTTCVSCPNGYTCAGGTYTFDAENDQGIVANTITINWHGALAADIATNDAGTVTYGGDIRTPVRPDPAQIPIGQRFKGWRFRKPTQN